MAEPRKAEEIKYTVWPFQVYGNHPDGKKRGITRDGDWRNPDILVYLDGARVEVRDEQFRNHQGSVEPDWSKGWYVWQSDSGQTRELFSGTGEPPAWVRTAKMEGRVIYGCVILRDEQQHGG